jgi:hypothetical protein
MSGRSVLLAVAIILALTPSSADAKSAVSRARSRYAHEAAKVATTAKPSPIAKADVKQGR